MDLVCGLFHQHHGPLARLLKLDEPSAAWGSSSPPAAAAYLRRPAAARDGLRHHGATGAAAAPPMMMSAVEASRAFDEEWDVAPEERVALLEMRITNAIGAAALSPSVVCTAAEASAQVELESSADDFVAVSPPKKTSPKKKKAPVAAAAVDGVAGFTRAPASTRMPTFDDITRRLKTPAAMRILRGIYAYGFEEPSPIQAASVYPIAGLFAGAAARDVVVVDRSGEGKTAAVAMGAVLAVSWDPAAPTDPQALILAPTRELAEQIAHVIDHLACYVAVDAGAVACGAALIGGGSVQHDLRRLDKGSTLIPRIAVANVGRASDLIRRGALRTASMRLLVLDEADLLLAATGSNVDALYDVFRYLPRDIRVAAVGTTFADPALWRTMSKFMRDPLVCHCGVGGPTAAAVEAAQQPERFPVPTRVLPASLAHYAMSVATDRTAAPRSENLASSAAHVPPAAVAQAINRALERVPQGGTALVFAPTRVAADFLADRLRKHGHRGALALHGDLQMTERVAAVTAFRCGSCRVVVTTENFGRGLDVPSTAAVIMVGMPQCPIAYAHCAGRAGRYGRVGVAITVVASTATDSMSAAAAASAITAMVREAYSGAEDDFVVRALGE